MERSGVNIFPKDISENFESFDDNVSTSGTLTDNDIVFDVNQKRDAEDEGIEEGVEEEHKISTSSVIDVKSAVNALNIFFQHRMWIKRY